MDMTGIHYLGHSVHELLRVETNCSIELGFSVNCLVMVTIS